MTLTSGSYAVARDVLHSHLGLNEPISKSSCATLTSGSMNVYTQGEP